MCRSQDGGSGGGVFVIGMGRLGLVGVSWPAGLDDSLDLWRGDLV